MHSVHNSWNSWSKKDTGNTQTFQCRQNETANLARFDPGYFLVAVGINNNSCFWGVLGELWRWFYRDQDFRSAGRWFERSHCLFVLAEAEGVGHEVIPAPVNHVFPYNRQSAIELIKLRRWHEGSMIKILFTNVHPHRHDNFLYTFKWRKKNARNKKRRPQKTSSFHPLIHLNFKCTFIRKHPKQTVLSFMLSLCCNWCSSHPGIHWILDSKAGPTLFHEVLTRHKRKKKACFHGDVYCTCPVGLTKRDFHEFKKMVIKLQRCLAL